VRHFSWERSAGPLAAQRAGGGEVVTGKLGLDLAGDLRRVFVEDEMAASRWSATGASSSCPRWPASFRSSSRADGLRVCRMDFLATVSEERFWLRALATMKDKGFGHLAVARLVTFEKASLRWPAKWPCSPAEMFLGEDGPQNIYGRLISALPSIRPYIDHRARSS
jgi:hypothetical protein